MPQYQACASAVRIVYTVKQIISCKSDRYKPRFAGWLHLYIDWYSFFGERVVDKFCSKPFAHIFV